MAFTIPRDAEVENLGRSGASLRKIIEAIEGDVNKDCHILDQWPEKGVMLFNTVLTIEGGKPLSHEKVTIEYENCKGKNQKWGWQDFSKEVLKTTFRKDATPVVYLLFGNKAINTMKRVLMELGVKSEDMEEFTKGEWTNVPRYENKWMFSTHHPAYQGGKLFMNERPFYKATVKLDELCEATSIKQTVKWSL